MIAAIIGFLFNRFSFFLLVLVIIAALVFFGKLIWNKYVIGGLALLAVVIGLWTYHDKLISDDRAAVTEPYIKQIKDNNEAAAKKLKEETDKNTALSNTLKTFSDNQGKIDATNIQTIAAFNVSHRTTRLRDPGGKAGGCSNTAQSANTGNTQSSSRDTPETSGLLSEQTSADIWNTDFESDQINVAYIACRAYAYKVREALIAETESGGIVLAMSTWK